MILIFVSFDDGSNWTKLESSTFPVVPVYDIDIKDNNMVVATHGRAFWILDDITVISQLNSNTKDDNVIFKPAPTYRILPPFGFRLFGGGPDNAKAYMASLGTPVLIEKTKDANGIVHTEYLDSGENPPMGVPIVFYLNDDFENAEMIITDANGNTVRSLSTEDNSKEENL